MAFPPLEEFVPSAPHQGIETSGSSIGFRFERRLFRQPRIRGLRPDFARDRKRSIRLFRQPRIRGLRPMTASPGVRMARVFVPSAPHQGIETSIRSGLTKGTTSFVPSAPHQGIETHRQRSGQRHCRRFVPSAPHQGIETWRRVAPVRPSQVCSVSPAAPARLLLIQLSFPLDRFRRCGNQHIRWRPAGGHFGRGNSVTSASLIAGHTSVEIGKMTRLFSR